MIALVLLAFVGGVLVGLVAARPRVRRARLEVLHDVPPPTLTGVVCLPNNQVRIAGSADAGSAGLSLVNLHVRVYDDPAHSPPGSPDGEGATTHGTTFPIVHTLPGGLTPTHDLAVVWAEYRAFSKQSLVYPTCSGSGSGSGSGAVVTARAVSALAAEQLEAVPRAYRLSPGPGPADRGPTGAMVERLSAGPEVVLGYQPEASTPVEPLWRADGEPEWTLSLLHRPGGFGAVLTAVCRAGDREDRHTWVTSAWRFHEANRLACEAEGPCLWVRPA